MALDADQIFVAGSGHLYVGAVDSTPPTNATGAPAAAFFDLGYTSEDGGILAPTKTVNPVKAWQSFFTLRNIVADVAFSLRFTLMQWNYETLRLAMGGGTTTGSAGTYHFTPGDPEDLDERAMIADFVDGTRIHRWYFPKGIITDFGEIQLNRAGAAGMALTYSPQLSEGVNVLEVFLSDSEFSAT